MKSLISFLTEHQEEVLYHCFYQFPVFYASRITHDRFSTPSFREPPTVIPAGASFFLYSLGPWTLDWFYLTYYCF